MKTQANTKILLIEKEYVANLHFPPQEVLHDEQTLEERRTTLFKATSLGNLEHRKVWITFEDEEGLKQINTTIWAVSNKKVILKGGRLLPAHRIHSVKIV